MNLKLNFCRFSFGCTTDVVSRLTFETLQHAEFANRDAKTLAYKSTLTTYLEVVVPEVRQEKRISMTPIWKNPKKKFPVSAVCHQYSLVGTKSTYAFIDIL